MRLDGGVTPSGSHDAEHYLPAFFKKEFPLLVQYLDLYLDSLYKTNLSPDQVSLLLEDESWWDGKDLDYDTPELRLLEKVKALDKYRLDHFGINARSTDLLDNKILKRKQNSFQTLDAYGLESSDGFNFGSEDKDLLPLEQWLREKNFDEIANSQQQDIPIDVINLIKISKYLFKIRGTTECARIFLGAMYNGDAYITLPRDKISTLDDNFVLDGDVKLRDDFEYDEFTYVINLVGSDYYNIGTKYFDMYKRVFHASGFRCILRVYTTEEWLLLTGDYIKQPDFVRVWEQFFNNKFANIMRGL